MKANSADTEERLTREDEERLGALVLGLKRQ